MAVLTPGLVPVDPAHGDEPIRIEPRFDAGRTGYVEITTQSRQTMSGAPLGPSPRTLVMQMAIGVLQRPRPSTAEGDAMIELQFDRIQYLAEGGKQAVSFDSDSPETAASHPAGTRAALSSLLGRKAMLRIGRGLDWAGVTGMAAAVEELTRIAGDDPTWPPFKSDLSDDNQSYVWGSSRLVQYPPGPVRPGDQWQRTVRQPRTDRPDMLYAYECTLRSVETRPEGRVAIIDFRGSVTQDEGQTDRAAESGARTRLDRGRFEGQARFSLDRNELVSQETVAELKATVTLPADRGSAGGTIDINTIVNSRVMTQTQAARDEQRTQRRRRAGGW